jgi:hypothetical protein
MLPGPRENAERDEASTFADTKAQQDEFEQHLREGEDFEEAAVNEAHGVKPKQEPEASNSMP